MIKRWNGKFICHDICYHCADCHHDDFVLIVAHALSINWYCTVFILVLVHLCSGSMYSCTQFTHCNVQCSAHCAPPAVQTFFSDTGVDCQMRPRPALRTWPSPPTTSSSPTTTIASSWFLTFVFSILPILGEALRTLKPPSPDPPSSFKPSSSILMTISLGSKSWHFRFQLCNCSQYYYM